MELLINPAVESKGQVLLTGLCHMKNIFSGTLNQIKVFCLSAFSDGLKFFVFLASFYENTYCIQQLSLKPPLILKVLEAANDMYTLEYFSCIQ
jgi:hypothetical protein